MKRFHVQVKVLLERYWTRNENFDGETKDLTHYIIPILYDNLGPVLLDEHDKTFGTR